MKVSFRARNGLDCSRLAAQFGGGGHREAAGATLPGPMAESVERVLEAVRQALDSTSPIASEPLVRSELASDRRLERATEL